MDPNQEDFVDDALNFDVGMKKKKKKKKDETTIAAPVAEAPIAKEIIISQPADESEFPDDGQLLQGLKKKKSKKPISEVEAEKEEKLVVEGETSANASLDDAESFRPERKKKRVRIDLASFERELLEGDFKFDAGSRREEDADGIVMEDDLEEKWKDSDREYTYKELLERAFRLMRVANPESGEKRRYTMTPPQVQKEGTKKTVFANFSDICKRMRRAQDHVIQYIYSELGTSGSVDGNQRLIIKGRFMPNQIENVLRRYIVEYVTCKVCKAPDTILTKENRLMFMQCEKCGATRSVMAIKSGFSAQVDRRRQ